MYRTDSYECSMTLRGLALRIRPIQYDFDTIRVPVPVRGRIGTSSLIAQHVTIRAKPGKASEILKSELVDLTSVSFLPFAFLLPSSLPPFPPFRRRYRRIVIVGSVRWIGWLDHY